MSIYLIETEDASDAPEASDSLDALDTSDALDAVGSPLDEVRAMGLSVRKTNY